MANEQNLVPFGERSEREARELGQKGGIASGKARRRKKSMKQKMQLLLSLPAADNDQAELTAMGVDPEDMDNEMVLVKALFLAAAEGDTRAFDAHPGRAGPERCPGGAGPQKAGGKTEGRPRDRYRKPDRRLSGCIRGCAESWRLTNYTTKSNRKSCAER